MFQDAEKLIEDRLVEINDKLCVHPSETVTEEDKITVEKIIKLVKQSSYGKYKTNKIYLFHKRRAK